jgi:hypothetical protein
MTRDNIIYLVIGALVVAVAVLGYQLYETKKQPTGVHINLGERGAVDREQVGGLTGDGDLDPATRRHCFVVSPRRQF